MNRRNVLALGLGAAALLPARNSSAAGCQPSPLGLLVESQTGTPVAVGTPVAGESPADLAEEAYVYAYPMVDNYRILHAYFVDKGGRHVAAAPRTALAWRRLVSRRARALPWSRRRRRLATLAGPASHGRWPVESSVLAAADASVPCWASRSR